MNIEHNRKHDFFTETDMLPVFSSLFDRIMPDNYNEKETEKLKVENNMKGPDEERTG